MITKHFILALLLGIGLSPAFAQWTTRTTPHNTSYIRVHNRSRDSVVICGFDRTAASSPNGGLTWNWGRAGGLSSFDSLTFVRHLSPNRVYSSRYECTPLCDNGLYLSFFNTTSGVLGAHAGVDEKMEDAYFGNGPIGTMVGQKTFGVYRSTNSGDTWSPISAPNGRPLYRIDFADNQTGYAVGELGMMIKTTNGGLNWTNISTASVFGNLFAVDFVTPQVGYVGGQDGLFKTTNGGTSWARIDQRPVQTMAFWTVNDGFVSSFFSTTSPFARRTFDGGLTWQSAGLNFFRDISCDKQGYCYVVFGSSLYFFDNPNPVSISETWTSEVTFYPNPASSGQLVSYQLPEGLNYTLQIYSMAGVLVHQQETDGGIQTLTTPLSQGLYMVRIESAGKFYQQRLVVQ